MNGCLFSVSLPQGAMGWSVSMVFLVILASLFTKNPQERSGSVVRCSASDHGAASM